MHSHTHTIGRKLVLYHVSHLIAQRQTSKSSGNLEKKSSYEQRTMWYKQQPDKIFIRIRYNAFN